MPDSEQEEKTDFAEIYATWAFENELRCPLPGNTSIHPQPRRLKISGNVTGNKGSGLA